MTNQTLSGLFPDTSILTLHNSELEVLPQVAFRLPRHTDRVLILDKVMIVANKFDDRSVIFCRSIGSHLPGLPVLVPSFAALLLVASVSCRLKSSKWRPIWYTAISAEHIFSDRHMAYP